VRKYSFLSQAAVIGFPIADVTWIRSSGSMLWIWIRSHLDFLDKFGSGIIFPDLKPTFDWLPFGPARIRIETKSWIRILIETNADPPH
jgi:hypothetical protein